MCFCVCVVKNRTSAICAAAVRNNVDAKVYVTCGWLWAGGWFGKV
jgi:hypothetical protein